MKANPKLKGLVWDEIDGAKFSCRRSRGRWRSTAQFDLAHTPNPPPPQKFGHHDHASPARAGRTRRRVGALQLLGLALEPTDLRRVRSRVSTRRTYRAYPMSRAEGQERYAGDPEFRITTKGADHPFHIHVNPCWVTRIEVPDEQGRLHNILDAPRWMDTMTIPRGGRVVFRSRFADYTDVGQPLPHPHARGSRNDAEGGDGAARRRRELHPADPRGRTRA